MYSLQAKNVNILVFDTEVYSNTGGQASKATPAGCYSEVRCIRQEGKEKGSRSDGYVLRLCIRSTGSYGSRQEPADEGYQRSRSIRRTIHHNRLRSMHQPRHKGRYEQVTVCNERPVDAGYWHLYRSILTLRKKARIHSYSTQRNQRLISDSSS